MLYIRLFKFISAVLCTALLAGCALGEPKAQPTQTPARARLGVFSWHTKNMAEEEAREKMFDILLQVGANEVYQLMNAKAAPSFLKRAKELQIDVYVLAGQPEWGLDTAARRMLEEVDRVAALRAQLGDAGPAGLMLDVEPYLTDAYKAKPERTMDKYLAALRKTYAYAQEAGVPLIVCIPYFFDTKGYTAQLNALIEEACDAVAVMNYQKKDEIGQIKTEMAAAKRAGKRLIHIYELQPPGSHDLTERNTYHRDGLPAVWDSRDKLLAYFNDDGLSFALHDYATLREMIAHE